jgi:hypothetical protein
VSVCVVQLCVCVLVCVCVLSAQENEVKCFAAPSKFFLWRGSCMSHPCVDVLRGSQQISLDCNSAHVDLRSSFTACWLVVG